MTANAQLEAAIEAAWEARDQITPATTGETREAIEDKFAASQWLDQHGDAPRRRR